MENRHPKKCEVGSATGEAIRTTCCIIGGGVIGLNLAFELACRGRNVIVLDQNEVGRGTSWAGAGILPPAVMLPHDEPLEQLRGLSHQLHPILADKLLKLTGIDTGFRQSGGLYIARTAGETATLLAQKSHWEQQHIQADFWNAETVVLYEPALKPLIDSGTARAVWHLPAECQLRNPRHLKALVAACRQLGVRIEEAAPVNRLHADSSGRIAFESKDQRWVADQVCICSGAWTRLLLDELSISTGILPIRGQMILYRSPAPLIQRIVNEGHRYLVPRDDGHLLAGSCEEEAGYEVQTTAGKIAELKEWAEGMLPQLATTPIARTWAGLRPGSFDGLPYLGRVPGWQQLYVAAGHYRAGLHLSCATAVVMADLMFDKQPPIDLSSFRIGRG